jgi:hypothetical protein
MKKLLLASLLVIGCSKQDGIDKSNVTWGCLTAVVYLKDEDLLKDGFYLNKNVRKKVLNFCSHIYEEKEE